MIEILVCLYVNKFLISNIAPNVPLYTHLKPSEPEIHRFVCYWNICRNTYVWFNYGDENLNIIEWIISKFNYHYSNWKIFWNNFTKKQSNFCKNFSLSDMKTQALFKTRQRHQISKTDLHLNSLIEFVNNFAWREQSYYRFRGLISLKSV